MEEIIKLWKELNIGYAMYEFSCGGDSMGDTELHLYDKEGNEVENSEISQHIENEIYDRVDFYVNSDGHYQGESGEVEIRLNDEGDDFDYSKCSTSEYSEEFTSEVLIEIDEQTKSLFEEKVSAIGGDDYQSNIAYKVDCILSDKEEVLLENLKELITDTLNKYEPEQYLGDLTESYRFETTGIMESRLLVQVSNSITVYTEE